jgi:hypothetical protein
VLGVEVNTWLTTCNTILLFPAIVTAMITP